MKTFSSISLQELRRDFGISIERGKILAQYASVLPDEMLLKVLERRKYISLRTEKALSEALIAPILIEVARLHEDKISLFSGESIEADKAQGLVGELDFAFTLKPHAYLLETPILATVEAKKQDFEAGITQCIAQLTGIQQLNAQENKDLPTLFGCVSTGYEWQFLRLDGKNVVTDTERLPIEEVGKILGIFKEIVNFYDPRI
jgi:hypothetical protein